MRTDGAEILDHAATAADLRRAGVPIVFLRAERGLLDAEPFYLEDRVTRWSQRTPAVRARTVPDTNHYSLLLSDRGAVAVAHAVRSGR